MHTRQALRPRKHRKMDRTRRRRRRRRRLTESEGMRGKSGIN